MKKLILIINVLFFICCNNQPSEKYGNYIYKTLNVQCENDKKEYFVILNPNTRCASCYLGAINNVTRMSNKFKITIITNYDISRYIKDSSITKIIDDENIESVNPDENFNSKFLIFKNKELLFQRTVSTPNVDSLEYYITNN